MSLDDYSFNSKCFESTLINPNYSASLGPNRCHQYSCSVDKTTITIISSYLQGFSLLCGPSDKGTKKTATFNNKNIGEVTCPSDYEKFCDNQNCKNFCSLNGVCIRG